MYRIAAEFAILALFITFLVLYLLERGNDNASNDSASSRTHDAVDPVAVTLTETESGNWKAPEESAVVSTVTSSTSLGPQIAVANDLDELERGVLHHMTSTTMDYSNVEPLLTIMTVSKPSSSGPSEYLKRNTHYAREMMNRNFEHVIAQPNGHSPEDRVQRGSYFTFRNKVRGKYVQVTDETDYVSNFLMLEKVKSTVESTNPKVIIFYTWDQQQSKFWPFEWRTFPKVDTIRMCNLIVREDIFKQREVCGVLANPASPDHTSDYAYAYNVLQNCEPSEIAWIGESFMCRDVTPNYRFISDESYNYVTSHIMGGLGNQLFQAAAAHAYAKDHGKTVVFDHRMTMASGGGVPRPTYFNSVLGWTTHDSEISNRSWNNCSEKVFNYSRVPNLIGNIKLMGYYQSAKYFERYRDDIVGQIKGSVNMQTLKDAFSIEDIHNPTVSFHIRRGDYVGSAKHAVQNMEYYEDSIRAIQNRLHNFNLHIVVFSDDLDWCLKNLPTALKDPRLTFTYVDKGEDYEQMLWMSECEHHIIANSSFSWWGAYLDQKNGSITVAPKKWFGTGESKDWVDIYIPDWMRL